MCAALRLTSYDNGVWFVLFPLQSHFPRFLKLQANMRVLSGTLPPRSRSAAHIFQSITAFAPEIAFLINSLKGFMSRRVLLIFIPRSPYHKHHCLCYCTPRDGHQNQCVCVFGRTLHHFTTFRDGFNIWKWWQYAFAITSRPASRARHFCEILAALKQMSSHRRIIHYAHTRFTAAFCRCCLNILSNPVFQGENKNSG